MLTRPTSLVSDSEIVTQVRAQYPRICVDSIRIYRVADHRIFAHIDQIKCIEHDELCRGKVDAPCIEHVIVLAPNVWGADKRKFVIWGAITTHELRRLVRTYQPLWRNACRPLTPDYAVFYLPPLTDRHFTLYTPVRMPRHEYTQDYLRDAIEVRARLWKLAMAHAASQGKAWFHIDTPKSADESLMRELFFATPDTIERDLVSFRFVVAVMATAPCREKPRWATLLPLFIKAEAELLRLRLATCLRSDAQILRLLDLTEEKDDLGVKPPRIHRDPAKDKEYEPAMSDTELKRFQKVHPYPGPQDADPKNPNISVCGMYRLKFGRWHPRTDLDLQRSYLCANWHEDDCFVPMRFERVLSTVARRQCVVVDGWAYTGVSQLASGLVDWLRTEITHAVANGQRKLREAVRGGKPRPAIWTDERAQERVAQIHRALTALEPGAGAKVPSDIKLASPAEYARFMKERAPACMHALHQKGHLPNKERVIYINFTTRAGIPRHLVLNGWRDVFNRHWAQAGKTSVEGEWKRINEEFKWAEGKLGGHGAQKRISCHKMAAEGLCPYMDPTKRASSLTADALKACSAHQQLKPPAAFTHYPMLRIRPRIEVNFCKD